MIEVELLKNGSRGEQVKNVQILLNGKGFRDSKYNELVVDGIFGDNTEFAVRSFQKQKKLKVDGKVGQETWTELVAR